MEVLIPTFSDLADIFIIAFLFYQGLCVLRRGGGWHILAAIVFLVVLSTTRSPESADGYLNAKRGSQQVLALVIIFQPELRALLARISLSRELNLSSARRKQLDLHAS